MNWFKCIGASSKALATAPTFAIDPGHAKELRSDVQTIRQASCAAREEKAWTSDQPMLNELINIRHSPVTVTEEDPAAVWAFNKTLRLVPLPSLLCAPLPYTLSKPQTPSKHRIETPK